MFQLRRLCPRIGRRAQVRYISKKSVSETRESELPKDVKFSTPTLRPFRDHFDLVVIGSGPAAQQCAIDSARRGKKVCMIDKNDMLGGVCVHTGTIPSKTLREAVLHVTGYRNQGFAGRSSWPREQMSFQRLLSFVERVEDYETEYTRNLMRRHGVEMIYGTARFLPPIENVQTIAVCKHPEDDLDEFSRRLPTDAHRHMQSANVTRILSADKYLLAVGTRPARRDDIVFDGERIFDSDQVLFGKIPSIPKHLIVVGAGVIGIEYASMFNIISGTKVTVIDGRSSILDFADKEVVEFLMQTMRARGARFLFSESLVSAKVKDRKVQIQLSSGKTLSGDGLLYALGRQANTDALNLEAVGLTVNKRGLISVNDDYQTAKPNIYAAGDCIGYPALASTSMEQGRLASVHMWNPDELRDDKYSFRKNIFPYGIYTVPEISMIGKSEEQLTAEGVDYEVGISRYAELARGQMLGGADGFLKLIFDKKTLKLLGAHCIGEGATEIIHIGQALMAQDKTIDLLRSTVFNYPTLAEAYRNAAIAGLGKVNA